MTDPRDPRVADALDRMPIPEHGDGFWAALGGRLAAETGPGPAERGRDATPSQLTYTPQGEDPMPVLDLRAPSEPEIRSLATARTRRARTGLFAIAAATAAAVATVGFLRASDDTGLTTVGDDTDPTAQSTDTTTAPPPSTPGPSTPDAAVVDWIEAIGAGDIEAAAELTGPRTRAYIEGLGGNVEGFLTEAQEGYGAWADTPDRSTTEIDLGEIDGEAVTIVVVSGTWRGEGEDGFRTDAIPAVRGDGGWVVEPAAFDPETGGRIEMVSPEPGENGLSGLAADASIEATASGNGAFYFSLEDGPVTEVADADPGAGARATWDPPGDMASQTHLLVVAYVDEGVLTAFAGTFAVEG